MPQCTLPPSSWNGLYSLENMFFFLTSYIYEWTFMRRGVYIFLPSPTWPKWKWCQKELWLLSLFCPLLLSIAYFPSINPTRIFFLKLFPFMLYKKYKNVIKITKQQTTNARFITSYRLRRTCTLEYGRELWNAL